MLILVAIGGPQAARATGIQNDTTAIGNATAWPSKLGLWSSSRRRLRRDCKWVNWKKKTECKDVAVSPGTDKLTHVAGGKRVGLAAVEALAHWSLGGDERREKPKITVLIYGQTARPNCGNLGKQMEAIKSQRRELFRPLEEKGFTVKAILATNSCPPVGDKHWHMQLREAYGEHLTDLTLDTCNGAKDRRCLLHRALQMWDDQQNETGVGSQDLVLMTRPDIMWLSRGPELVVALAHLASNGHFVWPFKCEGNAWNHWQCVADTAVALPAPKLAAYRKFCLGMVSCHPDSRGDGSWRTFDDPRAHGGYGVGGGYSGHGCYRCMTKAIEQKSAIKRQGEPSSPLSHTHKIRSGIETASARPGSNYRCFQLEGQGPLRLNASGEQCAAACDKEVMCVSWTASDATAIDPPQGGANLLSSLVSRDEKEQSQQHPVPSESRRLEVFVNVRGCKYVAWKKKFVCPDDTDGWSEHEKQAVLQQGSVSDAPKRGTRALSDVKIPNVPSMPVEDAQVSCCLKDQAPPRVQQAGSVSTY